MAAEPKHCSVCSTEFEPCFRYQVEDRAQADGGPRYFCRPAELQISLPVELVPRASAATDAKSRKSH